MWCRTKYWIASVLILGWPIWLTASSWMPQTILADDLKPVIVGLEANYQPYIFADDNGEPQGASVDYLQCVAGKSERKIEFTAPQPLTVLLDWIQQGKIDMITSISPNAVRSRYLSFSKPYLQAPAVLFAAGERAVQDTIKTVALGDGFGVVPFLQEYYPQWQLLFVDDDITALSQIRQNRADAAVVDEYSADYWLRIYPQHNLVKKRYLNFQYELCFGVLHARTDLLEWLNRSMALVSQQECKTIFERWNVLPESFFHGCWVFLWVGQIVILGGGLLVLRVLLKKYQLQIGLSRGAYKYAFGVLLAIVAAILLVIANELFDFSHWLYNTPRESFHWGEVLLETFLFLIVGLVSIVYVLYISLNFKKVLARMQTDEDRLNFALEGVNEGIWEWNIIDNTVYFSHQTREMLGLAQQEKFSLAEWHQKMDRETQTLFQEKFAAYQQGKIPLFRFEHLVTDASGRSRWVLCKGKWTDARHQEKMIGVYVDVQERKDSEQLLQQQSKELEEKTQHLEMALQHLQKEKHRGQASEMKFKMLAENANDVICTFGPDGEIFYVSPSIEKLLGYTIKEIKDLNAFAVLDEHKRQTMKRFLYQKSQQEDVFQRDIQLVHKDGTPIWTEMAITFITDQDDDFQLYLAIIRNIDQRKRTEEALLKSEHQFASFMENLPAAVYIKNEDFEIIYKNKYFHDWFDGQAAQVENWANRQNTNQDILFDQKALQDKHSEYYETFEDTSGEKRFFHFQKFRIDLPTKEILIGCVGNDITSRKKAEGELIAARNYQKVVFNSLPSVMIALDDEYKVHQWNVAAEQYTEILRAHALNREIWALLPQLEQHKIVLDSVLQVGVKQEIKRVKIFPQKGEVFNLAFIPFTFKDSRGLIIRMDDISESAKKEAQLLQAQKMETVGNLAGGLAHDFNNVLGGIIGTLSLMKLQIERRSEVEKELVLNHIETMEESGQRAKEMVYQLLTLSRKQEIDLQPVNLNAILGHVEKICRNTLDKSVELHFNQYRENALTRADYTQMEQVLLNLCVNAEHAMTFMRSSEERQGGVLKVLIELQKTDDGDFYDYIQDQLKPAFWKISVEDTGIGMDAEMVKRIFDPFFTTKSKDKGTGLGLSMVYNIIRQHDGFIHVYSEPGVGSCFSIYLPVLEKTGLPVKMQEDDDIAKGSGRILVIDDEKVIRKMMTKMLNECGYEVVTSGNPKEAIELYKNQAVPFDMVIMDMAMPKMTGKEVYEHLKEWDPNLKALLTSGFRENERIQEALRLGINGFLQKPFSLRNLMDKIHEILGN